jgi:hypothetical protein
MRARLAVLAALALAGIVSAAVPAGAQQVEAKGKRISVFAPPSDRLSARKIAEQGDAALERFAAELGVEVPDTRFKIFLYATEDEYAKAEEPRTKGVFRTNLAFTYAKDAEVHMVVQPRTGRAVAGGEAPGMLEALAMHELSHALQYKVVPSYDDQPDWLSEGFAELCAERAVAGEDTGCADRTPWFGDFFLDIREALHRGHFVPLERLLAEGLQGRDVHDRQVRYGEAWSLVRMLDSPVNEARRAKFRGFMQEVMRLPAGDDLPRRANARFREIFGTPTKGEGAPSLAALERELVKSIREAEVFPWQIIYRDLRANADGTLIVEAFPDTAALSVSTAPDLGPRARIKVNVEIANTGGKQADLIFGYRSPEDYYKLAFGPGFITLMRYDGKWHSIVNAACSPDLLAPDATHEIELIIDVARLYAKVDGKPAFRYALPDRSFGAGRFGIGAYDSRVRFSGFETASQ